MVAATYQLEVFNWFAKSPRGAHGIGLWKRTDIGKEPFKGVSNGKLGRGIG